VKFTDLFVRRPVLALVVSLLIVLAGLKAYLDLPVRQYPLLESSVISVTTDYPGAPAELMQGFVTQPINQSLASVEGVDYVSSTSVQGRSQITLRMALNQDSAKALSDVIAKVNQVKYRLPEQAYDPVIERSAGDATAVAYVGFSSDSLSAAAVFHYRGCGQGRDLRRPAPCDAPVARPAAHGRPRHQRGSGRTGHPRQ
jgi:multidrug efflux pump